MCFYCFRRSFKLLTFAPVAKIYELNVIIFFFSGETGVRRGRTTFLPAQTARLEREFIINPYIAKAQRDSLAEALGVQEKQVKVWFQNRRGREKRNKMAEGESTDQGGVGRTRGRRRGRQPKNMENSYMSSTRYQKPEITYIEEYTCKPEMRPERPASVIILDEGHDTSPYEEAPNRYHYLLDFNWHSFIDRKTKTKYYRRENSKKTLCCTETIIYNHRSHKSSFS